MNWVSLSSFFLITRVSSQRLATESMHVRVSSHRLTTERMYVLCLCACALSHVQLFVTPWTPHHAPLSLGFFTQEYWSGLPFPSPGNLPHPGIIPTSLTSPALAGGFFTSWATGEAPIKSICIYVYAYVYTYSCSCVNMYIHMYTNNTHTHSSEWVSEWKLLSCVWLFATLWTVPSQPHLSMEFSRPEYWHG